MNTVIETVRGSELRVGDTIKVWWSSVQKERGGRPNEEVITKLVKYTGSLDCFKDGARLADFRCSRTGMTIPNDTIYERVKRTS